MAIEARLRELNVRHQRLEAEISSEVHRPSTDEVRLKALKRQKLHLKEEMESLRSRLH